MTSPTGVLLINLGTPASPETGDVRRYLREFLSDGRVIDIHPVARALLVNLIIAPFRAPKSAHAYRAIWTPQGSPLLVHSEALAAGLAQALGQDWRVSLGMRYGEPSLGRALDALAGCGRIVVLPLYPQYASATTGTVLERLYALAAQKAVVPALSVVPPFYDHPAYVAATAAVTRPHIEDGDFVLFSYHGVPVRQLPCQACDQTAACPEPRSAGGAGQADCYRAHCYATSRSVAAALGLAAGQWTVSFQSRLGRIPWIEPYTDRVLETLAREQGVRRLVVLCPSFLSDCLETLEEIGIRAREQFLAAGGERLVLVPCLNSAPAWITAAAGLVRAAAGEGSPRRSAVEAML